MRQKTRLIPSPAMLVALVALVVAMSGAAIALPGKAQVKKDDIAKGAVTAKAIARNAVRGKQVAANAVTGVKVKDESLSSKDVSDYGVISSGAGNFVKLTATLARSEALGRTAAPATVLFKKGTITISAKCFRDTTADQTFGEVYIATSANGAIFDGSTDELGGGPGHRLPEHQHRRHRSAARDHQRARRHRRHRRERVRHHRPRRDAPARPADHRREETAPCRVGTAPTGPAASACSAASSPAESARDRGSPARGPAVLSSPVSQHVERVPPDPSALACSGPQCPR